VVLSCVPMPQLGPVQRIEDFPRSPSIETRPAERNPLAGNRMSVRFCAGRDQIVTRNDGPRPAAGAG